MKQGKMGVMRRKAYQIGVWIGAVILSIGLSSLIYAVNLTEGIKEIETEMKNLTVPNTVQVVGIGEASHGVKEYQEMKAEVFKALVANNGCQTFVIEGDFGGALSVEDYIHGGNQGATEAIKNIGFRIYETYEMVDLIKWMRTYNESVPEGKDLHFYGMDMQRFDQGKAYLFSVLDRALPEMSETYKKSLKPLTDAKRLELSKEEANKAGKEVETLLKEMESRKGSRKSIIDQWA